LTKSLQSAVIQTQKKRSLALWGKALASAQPNQETRRHQKETTLACPVGRKTEENRIRAAVRWNALMVLLLEKMTKAQMNCPKPTQRSPWHPWATEVVCRLERQGMMMAKGACHKERLQVPPRRVCWGSRPWQRTGQSLAGWWRLRLSLLRCRHLPLNQDEPQGCL